ncbi:MAG TPA: peptidylprolyl isomerase [Vicinamibacterales bacterium]|nr:peptidylprolyl isomerase [Vicinamibacterales bacterium]
MITMLLVCVLVLSTAPLAAAQQKTPGVGPTIVLETSKGTIEFETYPDEAPKTVARILQLVKKGFYTGLRFHRAEPNFLIQIGDPATRDRTRESWWGRGGSGTPIGVSEVSRKRRHLRGAVAMAHVGTDIGSADSQFYILLRAAPELDGKYTVFGHVTKGMDVVARIQFGDVLKKASVKAEPGGL